MANNKTKAFANDILEHVLNNADIANIGDAGGLLGSVADGNLYLSLHTADPTNTGNQTTNEVSYTGYARLAVARDGTKWTVTDNVAANAVEMLFGACTVGSTTAAAIGVGTDSAGAGTLLFRGNLAAPLAISPGITPKINVGAGTITES